MLTKMLRLGAFTLLPFLALGCQSVYDAKAAMREGGYQRVMTDTMDVESFPERDQTLILNYRAHSKMALGYHESATADYLRAWNIMNHGKGGGVAGAYFFSERQKWWMGDPYERAFNSWYLGMLYYQLGKPEDAMACFRNAIFVDTGDLKQGEYAADWLPAFVMRMRCFLSRGDSASVQMLLDEISRLPKEQANYDAACPWLSVEAQKDANVVLMLELGEGPFFTAEGHHGSQRVINQGEYREAYAEVFCDGQSLGRSYKIGDTFFQAITRGGRVMDDILKGKAIAKTATIATGATAIFVGAELAAHGHDDAGLITAGVGAAVLIAGLLMNAEADTRGNALLPGETHLLMAKLPPGKHELEVRYFDKGGSELRGMRQQGVPCMVPEQGDAALVLRSDPRYYIPRESSLIKADPYAHLKPVKSK
ncbi:MAG: tetratricopeptide repeat protein [Planctomycetes bacterium]|nr:tetratricopeptide repeat protein [Planctomycetota bacterium]